MGHPRRDTVQQPFLLSDNRISLLDRHCQCVAGQKLNVRHKYLSRLLTSSPVNAANTFGYLPRHMIFLQSARVFAVMREYSSFAEHGKLLCFLLCALPAFLK